MRAFLDEARLMAQLNHRNVVRIFDLVDDHRPPYVVLECVDGLNIQQILAKEGRLAPRHAVDVARQVFRGLRTALQIGIVHRDVKPANVLLTSEGCAKLTDFGLAWLAPHRTRPGSMPFLRMPDQVYGTPQYMAPEHTRGMHTDVRSDMYSVGAMLFEMLTGKPPFTGRPVMLAFKAATQPPPDPATLVEGLDPKLREFTLRLLSKSPHERFDDYDAVLLAMDDLE
jgi:serine/threonine-protein kinase